MQGRTTMNPSEQLYRLVYVSRSACPGDSAWLNAEVASILSVSQANNRKAGVTGALLFSTDCFAQALEGPVDEVTTTFERIQCDPRHRDTVILQAGWVNRREFGEWSMAYAGRVEDDRIRFAGVGTHDGTAEANTVLDAMRGVVLRSEMA